MWMLRRILFISLGPASYVDRRNHHLVHEQTLIAAKAIRAVLCSGKQEDLQPEELHHALKYGAPSTEHLRFFKNFVVSYDSRLRNPRWVMEHITRKQTRGEGNRQALSPLPVHSTRCTLEMHEGSLSAFQVCIVLA